jgi:flavin reductase (DIM6/NTAB) family NADH-FMN oxidoreductase RutF
MGDNFDPREFRSALGAFLTGVTVVTTLDEVGAPRGFTANSFTSVSLSPPLILVCIAKTASSSSTFCAAKSFAVNILSEGQSDVSSIFSSRIMNRFKKVEWRGGRHGSPILAGIAAWFDCLTHRIVEAGDHFIIIGHVTDFGHLAQSPLGYCRGAYLKFSLSQAAVAANGDRTRVGVILERDGKVALIENGDRGLCLPTGSTLESAADPTSLRGRLAKLGLAARLEFLFSVFESRSPSYDGTSIYYRGALEKPVPEDAPVQLVRFNEIDFERVDDPDERSMLRRFVRQRSENSFEIFAGTNEGGRFHPIASGPPDRAVPEAAQKGQPTEREGNGTF